MAILPPGDQQVAGKTGMVRLEVPAVLVNA
jgi:hypothetical protein